MEFSKEQVMLNKINQIGSAAYKAVAELDLWETETGFLADSGRYENIGAAETIRVGDHWRCADGGTRWFRADVAVPAQWAGQPVYLELDFGGEGLVRIDGRIASAVTSFVNPDKRQRERVLFTRCARGGDVHKVEAECGLNYMEFAKYRRRGMTSMEYTVRKARLCLLDEAVQAYYFDAMVAYEALAELAYPYETLRKGNVKPPHDMRMFMYQNGKDSYMHSKVLDALLQSLSRVDVDFDRDTLTASIPEASRILREALDAIGYTARGHICFTGNAHIDTAWLWPIKETVRKCAKTFSNTLALMEQYPDYVFAASQPWQYDALKTYYPELFEQVKKRVAEGRWELIGNAWVEADANIPSGEALVRQLLYGREFFLREFGTCSDVYWMPDVFGYSWALPQIIRRSGMKYFFTSKLNNNDVNRFPYTLFMWQGVDGTRIPSYLQRTTYNGEINPYFAAYSYSEFDEKAQYDRILQTYGFGDGGGGPTYQMLEYAKRIERFPGLPDSSLGRTSDFFDGVPPERLPVWNDEMYYEFHRGTYTSQAEVKRNNRKGELSYRQTEMLCGMAGILLGREYPMEELTKGWKLLLLNQFHDIIPGSSIHAVYEDVARDYADAFAISNRAQETALGALTDAVEITADSVVVYNFLSWDHTGVVTVPLPADRTGCAIADTESAVCTEDGKTILRFIARNVPSMGYRAYALVKRDQEQTPAVSASKTGLENGYLSVSLDERGLITSIYDKQAEREVLMDGSYGNLLTVYEDKPAVESAWNIDIEYRNKFWDLTRAERVSVVECSPVRAAVEVVRKFNRSTITQRIILGVHSRRLDFETRVQWHETEKMLKAAFTADILSPKATYEIAYGAIERPTHTNTLWDKAKFEVPAHKWADLSEGNYGVALLNDCKYGYDIHDRTLRITLLRSPVYPDPTADQGGHEFVYSLYPHSGGWRGADVVREAYELNVPLTGISARPHAGSLPREQSWIGIDGSGAVLEAFKQSQDGEGYILRVYEARGGRTKTKVTLRFPAGEVWETNLMETKETPVALEKQAFTATLAPYEIKTFFIR